MLTGYWSVCLLTLKSGQYCGQKDSRLAIQCGRRLCSGQPTWHRLIVCTIQEGAMKAATLGKGPMKSKSVNGVTQSVHRMRSCKTL